MKNVLLAAALLILILLTGCQQAQQATSTKYSDFLGITLGQSYSAVKTVLGDGSFSFTASGVSFYAFGSDKLVGFKNDQAAYISASSSGYSIASITMGNTTNYVSNTMGNPEKTSDASVNYFWIYPSKNLRIRFEKTTDLVNELAVYDPLKLDL